MMTTVHVDLREPDFATPVRGALLFTPTRRVVEDTFIVLPRPFSVTLAGVAVDVEVQPTGASWVWTVHEQTTGGTTRNVAVSNSPTPVNYRDLVDVDPATLAPTAEPEAAWWAAIADANTIAEDPNDEGTYLIGAV